MDKKFSEFGILNVVTNDSFLAGYEDSSDPNIPNSNFRIKIEDIYQSLISVGSGRSLIKKGTGKDLELYSIEGIGALQISLVNDVLQIELDETQLNLLNQQGIIPMSKGGTGQNLVPFGDDVLFANVNGDSILIKLGNGLSIVGDTLEVNIASILTTKGDLYTRNNSGDIRLPVGLDGQVLKANSSTTTGLEWDNITATDKTKADDTSTTDGYLNDLLVTQSPVTKTLINSNEQLQLGLNVAAIDLAQANNANSQFITAAQVGGVNYDSGWHFVKDYDASTQSGVIPHTNFLKKLMFRVVNNIIFLEGNVIIPMTDSTGTDYYSDFFDVMRNLPTQPDFTFNFPNLNKSGDNSSITMPRLFPDINGSLSIFSNVSAHRTSTSYLIKPIFFLDGEGTEIFNQENSKRLGMLLYTPVETHLNIQSFLTIYSPIKAEKAISFDFSSGPIEGLGNVFTSDVIQTDWRRLNIPKFNYLDQVVSFENYFTSANFSASTLNNNLEGLNISGITGGPRYGFNYDGADCRNWGGSFLRLSYALPINRFVTQSQIEDFFENYINS